MTALKPIRRLWGLSVAITVCIAAGIITADAFAAQATLAWDPNTESDLAGYKIHYGTVSGNYTAHLDVHNVTTYTVTGLTDGQTYYFAASAYNASGKESGYSNQVVYSPASPLNRPPVITAGPQAAPNTVTLPAATTVSVTASDADGTPLTYAWSKAAGPGTATFTNASAASTAVALSAAGSYTLAVAVSDGETTVNGNVNVTVLSNSAPASQVASLTLVNSATDKDIGTLANGAVINLSVTGTSLNIRANVSGPVASVRFGLDGNTNLRTENAAPYSLAGDSSGDYSTWTPALGSHSLTATPYSAAGGTGTAGIPLSIAFTVTNVASGPTSNKAPTANAGSDQTVNSGAAVTLRGSGSDPENAIAGYQWRQTSGTTVALSNAASAQANLTAPSIATGNATLVFELRVTDAGGVSATDSVSIVVQSADVDGDGASNGQDAFPANPAEWKDSDGDGIGDNADPDDNNNGIPDSAENLNPRHSIAVFRPSTAVWLVDLNANRQYDGRTVDGRYKFGINGDIPVTGDWDGDGVTDIGVFRPSTGEWFLDLNANRKYDGRTVDGRYKLGINGDQPVTGDWNGDGVTDIGVFCPSTGEWFLDLNANRKWDGNGSDGLYTFGKAGDRPVTGDWNDDGLTEIGVFRPSTGEWLLDLNANDKWNGRSVDGLYQFGQPGDLPATGRW
jgi:hypothetical protein